MEVRTLAPDIPLLEFIIEFEMELRIARIAFEIIEDDGIGLVRLRIEIGEHCHQSRTL
ncbi:MAG: hypothetical protein JJ891_12740 [Rhizobiaceae bacterium]|nr:hypothetical protein [Rhizobiaceae bacterium]